MAFFYPKLRTLLYTIRHKMKNVLLYNDFIGSVDFSADDEVFFGKVEGIDDLVSFEGSSVSELKAAFESSVDDYIEFCKLKKA